MRVLDCRILNNMPTFGYILIESFKLEDENGEYICKRKYTNKKHVVFNNNGFEFTDRLRPGDIDLVYNNLGTPIINKEFKINKNIECINLLLEEIKVQTTRVEDIMNRIENLTT